MCSCCMLVHTLPLPLMSNFTLNLLQIIMKIAPLTAFALDLERNESHVVLGASGRVTFELPYDAFILHAKHR